jgi:hypothetical protein
MALIPAPILSTQWKIPIPASIMVMPLFIKANFTTLYPTQTIKHCMLPMAAIRNPEKSILLKTVIICRVQI